MSSVHSDICGLLLHRLRHEVRGRLTIGRIVQTLQERAYALVILFLTLPNGVPGPTIPGMSTLTGIPVLILALEAASGRKYPRLPRFAARRRLNRYRVIRHLERVRPYILNVESMMRPRLDWLPRHPHLVFAFCAVFSMVLALPIPLGNLPAAWAIILLSLGMAMKDGLFVLFGLIAGCLATAWNALIVVAGIGAAHYLLSLF